MAKTKEELYALKEEYIALNEKLTELTDEELNQVTGGSIRPFLMESDEDTAITRDCYISPRDTEKVHPASCATAIIRCGHYEKCCNPGKVYHE